MDPTEVEELGGAALPEPAGCGLRVGGGRRVRTGNAAGRAWRRGALPRVLLAS